MRDIICTLLKEESKRESTSENHILYIALALFENMGQINLFQWSHANISDSNNVVAY